MVRYLQQSRRKQSCCTYFNATRAGQFITCTVPVPTPHCAPIVHSDPEMRVGQVQGIQGFVTYLKKTLTRAGLRAFSPASIYVRLFV